MNLHHAVRILLYQKLATTEDHGFSVIANQSPDIRPKDPVSADGKVTWGMLLRTARANAMVIADLGGLDSDGQDADFLFGFLNRAHPRLTLLKDVVAE